MRTIQKGGICPYHKNCLEGFASGPSIEARWGKKAVELVDRPEVWEMESYYIAQALVDYIMLLSPQKIILGGGVMHQEQLFPMIRQKGEGDVKRLYQDKGTGRHGQLHCSGKPSR